MRRQLRPVGAGDGAEFGIRPIRVVVADDHPALRRNLTRLLEREEDLEVVGVARDLEAAIVQVGASRPHVLVLDLGLPDGSSAERIQRLHEQSPRTGIVVITMNANEMLADHTLDAGASGFVLTDSADLELCDAVRCAARGLEYRSPRVRAS